MNQLELFPEKKIQINLFCLKLVDQLQVEIEGSEIELLSQWSSLSSLAVTFPEMAALVKTVLQQGKQRQIFDIETRLWNSWIDSVLWSPCVA